MKCYKSNESNWNLIIFNFNMGLSIPSKLLALYGKKIQRIRNHCK